MSQVIFYPMHIICTVMQLSSKQKVNCFQNVMQIISCFKGMRFKKNPSELFSLDINLQAKLEGRRQVDSLPGKGRKKWEEEQHYINQIFHVSSGFLGNLNIKIIPKIFLKEDQLLMPSSQLYSVTQTTKLELYIYIYRKLTA